ncbi:MAG: hypothetical protein R3F07_11960 [Opitutaceae bacterium]
MKDKATSEVEPKAHYRIYVIRLDDSVLELKKFRDVNPSYREGKPCYYVGMTGKPVRERFKQHIAGYKSSRMAKKYGKWLAKSKMRGIGKLTYEEAVEREPKLAEKLRQKGYGVWQH